MKTKNKISATILADSLNSNNVRITTFKLVFPRIILSELNTHRAFSRNSASSRAIPFKKMVKMVKKDPFIPIAWQKDHKGMQGKKYFYGFKVKVIKMLWLMARNFAVIFATILNKFGLTKQICNRILEPFMWHTAIVTATDYENFFALRNHHMAEIHIKELARCMLCEYNINTPEKLKAGEWHVPYGDRFNTITLEEMVLNMNRTALRGEKTYTIDDLKIMIATARCARISYLNFLGKDDYKSDIKLHDRLAKEGHWSPFEHCASANYDENYSGNFRGFSQYRKGWSGENKTYKRALKNKY